MTTPTHLAPGADASSENATLRVSGLEVNYGSNIAIRDVSIAGLAPGSVNALLGPNGSGKSTLLKALAGLVSPQKGAVRLGRHDLTQASVAQRAGHVVYVPQSLPDAVHLRVIESVLVAANVGKTSNTSHHDAYAMLQRLGIAALALRYLDELSGGQKQLVGLAQALIRRPRVLLLDEPLSALDLNYQFHVMQLLQHETRQHQLITIVALHDLNVALRHTDYALMLCAGSLHAWGPPETVIQADNLSSIYGVDARVEACSQNLLHVIVDGLNRKPD